MFKEWSLSVNIYKYINIYISAADNQLRPEAWEYPGGKEGELRGLLLIFSSCSFYFVYLPTPPSAFLSIPWHFSTTLYQGCMWCLEKGFRIMYCSQQKEMSHLEQGGSHQGHWPDVETSVVDLSAACLSSRPCVKRSVAQEDQGILHNPTLSGFHTEVTQGIWGTFVVTVLYPSTTTPSLAATKHRLFMPKRGEG